MMELTKRELERYSRQIVFPKLGKEGQSKLKGGRIAVLGLGGLGSAAAIYLTCAGVGYIKLIDRDFVELDNIQRQIIFNEDDAKDYKPKAIAAKEKLERMNSDIAIEAVVEDFNSRTAEKLIEDVEIVVDGTDNMETRYLLNEVCVKKKKPFVHAAALGDVGALTTILPGKTPCLKCIFPKIPAPGELPTCEIAGVIGGVPGLIGVLQAMEVIKYLANFGELLTSKLLYFHLSSMSFDVVKVKRNLGCDVCAKKQFPLLSQKREQAFLATLCGRNAVQIVPRRTLVLDLKKLATELERNPEFRIEKITPYLLVLDYHRYRVVLMPSGRALIKNAKSEKEAKAVISKVVSF